MNGFWLGGLPLLRSGRSCSINWENRTGAKGEGCREASALGESRKGSPCIRAISPGETVALAEGARAIGKATLATGVTVSATTGTPVTTAVVRPGAAMIRV